MIDTPNKNAEFSITTIDMLRHGECVGGACYRGKLTDHALTDKGLHEMRESVGRLSADWDCIVTSSLKRCASFATSLSRSHNISLSINKNLREINFGLWEGQSIDHVWRFQSQQVEAWFNDPVNCPPPEGEPADVFVKRVVGVCDDLVEDYAGKKLLLICHGGVIRVLLGHCLGVNYQFLNRFDVPHGCVSRIQVVNDGENRYYRLMNHNIGASD